MNSPKKRDFISFEHLTNAEVTAWLDLAARQKADPNTYRHARQLHGRVIGLYFEKASMRTRLSFETAIYQLGGNCIYMGVDNGRLGEREAIKDVARVASRYLDALVLRTYSHEAIVEMAQYSSKPVINALSDLQHPCQALGDLLTIREKLGRLQNLKVSYIGDCNNVCRSLAQAVKVTGGQFTIGCPPTHSFDAATVKGLGAQLLHDPIKAIKDADVVYTDVWASMGQEKEVAKRRKEFQAYQINETLLKFAPKAIVMHCLPAHRDDEITDAVMEGPQSVVFDQAENRLHVQRALLTTLLP